jgi:L-lactate dehydrogenase (cytochrome)
MAKLGHPDGEINLTKGAGRAGIIQGVSPLLLFASRMTDRMQISINASCSLDEMLEARKEGQDLFFQACSELAPNSDNSDLPEQGP